MRAEPEVYASNMGEDSSTLYVPVSRYPTALGALRAIHRSPWYKEARWDGWDYRRTGEKIVSVHGHGPEGCPRPKPPTCRPAVLCHVFVAAG